MKRSTSLPLDVHLMIEAPERYVDDFVRAGANTLAVQVEACPHLHRTVVKIREAGARAAVALNPSTPAASTDKIEIFYEEEEGPRGAIRAGRWRL